MSLAPCSYSQMVNLCHAQSSLIGCGEFSPLRGLKAIFPSNLQWCSGSWCWISNAYQLYIRTPSEALVGISSQQAWHPVSLRLRVPFVICSAFDIAAKSSTVLSWACTAVNGVTLTVCCIPFVSVLSCFSCNCCSLVLGLLESEVPFHPCMLAPPFLSTKEIPDGWGVTHRVAMDTSSSC